MLNIDRLRSATWGNFPRHYWTFVGGQCFIAAADNFISVAVAAFTYALTGSAWAYALQMLLGILPSVLLSRVAGRAVDRLDRRLLLIVSDACSVLLILLYPFCRVPIAIYGLNFVRSTAGAFAIPARIALMPRLVGGERLLRANGVRTMLVGAVNLIVPSLAGAIVGWTSPSTGFVFASVCVISAIACWAATPRLASSSAATSDRPGQQDSCAARSTARLASLDPALIATIILFSVYSIGVFGTNAIYYPFISSVVRAGPWFFGVALSLYYGSHMIGGLVVARLRRARLSLTGLILAATALWAVLPMLRATVPLLVVAFASGLLYCAIATVYETTLQERSPAGATGQVVATARAVVCGAEVLGILACGWLAERWGPVMAYRWAFAVGIALTLVGGLSTKLMTRRHASAIQPSPTANRIDPV